MFGIKRKQHSSPTDLTIDARKIEFSLVQDMKDNRYWHSNDPVTTHFFNALQSTFPEGERYFIDSARDARNKIGKENLSSTLQSQIDMFIRQEAYHGQHHEDWNQALTAQGYDKIEKYSEELKSIRLWAKKNIPAETRLSITSAAEHFTASMAHLFIYKRPDFIRGASESFQQVLLYHALEEVEHKAVCFDLYTASKGGYKLRMLGLVFSSINLMKHVSKRHIYLLKQDGQWTLSNRLKAMNLIWGPKGIAIQLLPYILMYTKPNFHPWETDERAMLRSSFQDIFDQLDAKIASPACT
ncbi:hypothetical protein A9Q99_12910 [Gammaproteobacteria bacterium 45_16_T64]|nr:hypothetical protein A9Q99_12910 [Gammaproteobacteria bacterium 45_16_T64]